MLVKKLMTNWIVQACRWELSDETAKNLLKIFPLLQKELVREDIYDRDTLIEILSDDNPERFFRNIDKLGLLSLAWKDLASGRGCEQNKYHTEDVLNHSIRTLEEAAKLTSKPLVRLAALAHDIGKPFTKKIIDGKATFYKHDVVGALLVANWMKEVGFNYEEIDKVSILVRHHQFFFRPEAKLSTISKWIKKVGFANWEDLLTIRAADRRGNLANKDKPMITAEMRRLIHIVDEIQNE